MIAIIVIADVALNATVSAISIRYVVGVTWSQILAVGPTPTPNFASLSGASYDEGGDPS